MRNLVHMASRRWALLIVCFVLPTTAWSDDAGSSPPTPAPTQTPAAKDSSTAKTPADAGTAKPVAAADAASPTEPKSAGSKTSVDTKGKVAAKKKRAKAPRLDR